MISLARFHSGERIAINPDLIERIEETPDTVVTLTSGTKYVVGESIDEITEKVQVFRATLLNLAFRMAQDPDAVRSTHLHVVRGGSSDLDDCDSGGMPS
jgi:flagellar protein FlbD